jgi:2-C-methyl-D-erythritol 4-phosphate cytidylyltransferase / 2-C-methyl-D-erythritol 2,4-cyclodiphosphate synthase
LSGPGPSDVLPDVLADVIVVAAGASRRMDGIDKLLAPIAGRPMLAWTLDAIAASPVVERIVVVASAANVETIGGAAWLPDRVSRVVLGGDRRQVSVAAGMDALRGLAAGEAGADPSARVVLVHDGARPLVSAALIEAVARATAVYGAAIPVVAVVETVKRVAGELVAETVDRSELVTAQTPQGVRAGLLGRAYEQFPPDGPETWTDEAALLEACRIPVHVVPGDPSNLKVTEPADLRRVESIVAGAGLARVGIGHDSHPFGPGGPLALGGIVIVGAPRLHGHSDGDVVLHALADALLGAAGLGDLGRLFPADDRTPRGIASTELLAEVCGRIAAAGWRPAAIDLTIVAARPRLTEHLEPMRNAIAALLRIDRDAVNIKASTGNLDGSEGAGRGISALVVATLAVAS